MFTHHKAVCKRYYSKKTYQDCIFIQGNDEWTWYNLYAFNITTSVPIIVSCAHNKMVSEENIVAFPPNIIMTAQDITIIYEDITMTTQDLTLFDQYTLMTPQDITYLTRTLS